MLAVSEAGSCLPGRAHGPTPQVPPLLQLPLLCVSLGESQSTQFGLSPSYEVD